MNKKKLKIIKSNEEMLDLIRKDRPSQVINNVIDFKINSFGFYTVSVDMESMFFETKILHIHTKLPYPSEAYEKLSLEMQLGFRWGLPIN